MPADVLIGLQWGDEGKGKIVDHLAPRYGLVARFQGGPNAGHTLVIDGRRMVLHTVPSGILHDGVQNLIGNGVVIDPVTLVGELESVEAWGIDWRDRLVIDERAHLILPTHKALDAASEKAKGAGKIGSTLRGIGPTYMDKTGRNGLRIGDILRPDFDQRYQRLKEKHLHLLGLYEDRPDISHDESAWFDAVDRLRGLRIVSGVYLVNDVLDRGERVLAEGAQGSLLDIDFGTYPFVTSSNTITAGACKGLGISPRSIDQVIGISKAYCTRVGSGPFPTELHDTTGQAIREAGGEFGATTGRPRRCGWIDLAALRYANLLNGTTQIAMTKADVLCGFEQLRAGVGYRTPDPTDEWPMEWDEDTMSVDYRAWDGWGDLPDGASLDDMPPALRTYIADVQEILGVPITLLSTGPGRDQLLVRASTTGVAP